jgi:hypothetical protein
VEHAIPLTNDSSLREEQTMKATAIALLIVSAYWIAKGVGVIQEDPTKGIEFIVPGLLLLPLARYLWSKNIGGSSSSLGK